MNYIVSLGDARPDEGVNLHSIARELKVSPEKVTEECAKLSENGVLYSTTDDDQFVISSCSLGDLLMPLIQLPDH